MDIVKGRTLKLFAQIADLCTKRYTRSAKTRKLEY